MDLCKNCKHYEEKNVYLLPACTRELRTSPVSGSTFYVAAQIERGFGFEGSCGPDGKFFEPTKSGITIPNDKALGGHYAESKYSKKEK